MESELELYLEAEILQAGKEAAENEARRSEEPYNRLYWYAVARREALEDVRVFIQRMKRHNKRMRRTRGI